MLTDLIEVKNTKHCVEIATVDAYDECEITAGWHSCLSEILSEFSEVEVLGDTATYQGLIQCGNQILVKVRKKRRSAFVSLSSIIFPNPPAHVKIWTKAYTKYVS